MSPGRCHGARRATRTASLDVFAFAPCLVQSSLRSSSVRRHRLEWSSSASTCASRGLNRLARHSGDAVLMFNQALLAKLRILDKEIVSSRSSPYGVVDVAINGMPTRLNRALFAVMSGTTWVKAVVGERGRGLLCIIWLTVSSLMGPKIKPGSSVTSAL